jgi:hypothetical protein
VLTKWKNINLQGLVFAMHVGYTLTGMLLLTCVQLSDWESLSKNIQEQMAANPDDFDSDSDESSTSSSCSHNPYEDSPNQEEEEEEEDKKDK